MIFLAGELPGLVVVEPERRRDERGSFARVWCRDEFAANGIAAELVQCNLSLNDRRGTLRGLHFQAAPHGEAKLVRCARGRIFDVALDVRAGSPTYGRWAAVELAPEDGRMVFIPEGFAHGFQTLEDDSEVVYQMSAAYCPVAARGVRWDDPTLAIPWPVADPIVSARDRALPPLAGSEAFAVRPAQRSPWSATSCSSAS